MFSCKSNTSRMDIGFNCNSVSWLSQTICNCVSPLQTRSNNFLQFKLTNTALSNQWRQIFWDEDVLNNVSSQEIRWNFTTALALWQGGFYKRLVGMVKRSMKKAIGRKQYSVEQLITGQRLKQF